MAARIAVYALLIAIGIGTALLQLDRQTRVSPALSGMVPWIAKSQSLAQEADFAVQTRADNAYALSRELLLRRPVPAEPLTLFSLAAAEKGYNAQADGAMALAAARGWRVAIPNLLALSGAYAAGDMEGAVYRLTALARMRFDDQVAQQGTGVIAQSPEGRAALARYAKDNASVASLILQGAGTYIPAKSVREMVERAQNEGASFTCADREAAVDRLLRTGNGREAKAIWRESCLSSETASAATEFVAQDGGPFGWHSHRAAGLSRTRKGEVVSYRNRDPMERVIADKYLLLEPGSYRLTVDSDDSKLPVGTRKARVSLALSCLTAKGRRGLGFDATGTVVSVDAECPVQQVNLRMGSGQADLRGLTITRL